MARKKSDHIHKYKRVNLSKEEGKKYWVYKCVKPGCSHYVPTDLSEGLICECNKCENPMIITKLVLKGYRNGPLVKPHCPDCSKNKTNEMDRIAAFLEGKQ